ncbi:GntR family transcriptional regulator [Streptomyces sp. SD11]|uniref:GntR family transcriptional regulator n=1 Tax=Streptomyces sp. SD11 TaxID=3452209 RepID=UPI003F89C0A6
MPEVTGHHGRKRPGQSWSEQIGAVIHARLADGTYPLGTALPPLRTLAAEFNVSYGTVDLALRPLKDKAILRESAKRNVVVGRVRTTGQPLPQDQVDDRCGVHPEDRKPSGNRAEAAAVPHDEKPVRTGRNETVEHVRETIRERLASGRYPPGSRVPKQSELADEFGVSERLVRDVLQPLQTDGTLYIVSGWGTYVTVPDEASRRGTYAAIPKETSRRGFRDRVERAVRQRITDGTYPPLTWLPPLRVFTDEFEVSSATAHLALAPLKDEKLLGSVRGKTYVIDPQEPAALPDTPPPPRRVKHVLHSGKPPALQAPSSRSSVNGSTRVTDVERERGDSRA